MRTSHPDLYDMHGNVFEWVEDCWHHNCDDAPIDGRAWTTNCDGLREVVMRGGSYNSVPQDLRSAFRLRFPPSNRRFGLGFRLVQYLNS